MDDCLCGVSVMTTVVSCSSDEFEDAYTQEEPQKTRAARTGMTMEEQHLTCNKSLRCQNTYSLYYLQGSAYQQHVPRHPPTAQHCVR